MYSQDNILRFMSNENIKTILPKHCQSEKMADEAPFEALAGGLSSILAMPSDI